jgi:hypothetical protein
VESKIKDGFQMNEKRRSLLYEIGIIKSENKLSKRDWDEISEHKKLSEEFIEEFKSEVDWINITMHQKLSENFFRKFEESVYWSVINYQIISEDFIREFEDRLSWNLISRHQKMSEDFICEFQHKINWKIYFFYQEVTFNIIKKFVFKTGHKDTNKIKCTHLKEKEKKELEKLLKLKYMFVN